MMMKMGEILGCKGGPVAEYGRLTYIMGVEWKKNEKKSMGLKARAEGLIDQNPVRVKKKNEK